MVTALAMSFGAMNPIMPPMKIRPDQPRTGFRFLVEHHQNAIKQAAKISTLQSTTAIRPTATGRHVAPDRTGRGPSL